MKQLFFLLLFPCLALAQYQGNGNQKITLGEQTTADGLVYRGLAADTTRKPSVDTMAYILLDTNTNIIWQYKKAVNNAWTRLNLLPSDTTSFNYVNTYATQTVNGAKTFTSAVTATRFNPTANTATGTGMYLPSANHLGLSANNANRLTITDSGNIILPFFELDNTNTLQINQSVAQALHIGAAFGTSFIQSNNYYNGNNYVFDNPSVGSANITFGSEVTFQTGAPGVDPTTKMIILNNGDVGIGTTSPAVQFHTTGGVRFAGLTSITDLRTDASGNLFNGSDFNLKNSIDTINFGLSDVLKLKPVSFNWNDEQRNINEYKSMGFIAQDVMNIIPNAASTMGDGDMQVDYNAIVATLTKAIQEQQTLIKALEQRIINLENK